MQNFVCQIKVETLCSKQVATYGHSWYRLTASACKRVRCASKEQQQRHSQRDLCRPWISPGRIRSSCRCCPTLPLLVAEVTTGFMTLIAVQSSLKLAAAILPLFPKTLWISCLSCLLRKCLLAALYHRRPQGSKQPSRVTASSYLLPWRPFSIWTRPANRWSVISVFLWRLIMTVRLSDIRN